MLQHIRMSSPVTDFSIAFLLGHQSRETRNSRFAGKRHILKLPDVNKARRTKLAVDGDGERTDIDREIGRGNDRNKVLNDHTFSPQETLPLLKSPSSYGNIIIALIVLINRYV